MIFYKGALAGKLPLSDIVKTESHRDPDPLETVSEDNTVRKALVIDDESDIRYLLSGILKQRNIQVVTVSTLAEAEQVLKSMTEFYYIFLDNHLPDGFGIDRIRQLKIEHPETRLIIITAHDSKEERQKARMDGADFFISKPFSRESIYKTIEAA
jgi:two-component system OmpR family response regulator